MLVSQNWEKQYHPIIRDKQFTKKFTSFQYYIMNITHTVCCTNLITIHSLVYRPCSCEAIVLIILGYHKTIILLLLCYQCMTCYMYK